MVSHADVRAHCVVNDALLPIFALKRRIYISKNLQAGAWRWRSSDILPLRVFQQHPPHVKNKFAPKVSLFQSTVYRINTDTSWIFTSILFCQSCNKTFFCLFVFFKKLIFFFGVTVCQDAFTDLADEFLCRVWHEDTITPGGTAGVHVLRGFSVLFTVGVAERSSACQTHWREWQSSTDGILISFTALPGRKFYVLFPDNIIKGSGFFIIFQKL